MAGHEAQPSLLQPSLLQGFPDKPPVSGPPLASVNPVARVVLESSLPHLDRPFDYSVPAELGNSAVPGVRVKVKFNGQELNGFVLERVDTSDAGHPLTPLHKVISTLPVLTPQIAELAGTVAARYAGTLSDVLRTAVPPRVAKVEKELLSGGAAPESELPSTVPDAHAWGSYSNGASYLHHLTGGGSPKAVLTALQGFGPGGWPSLVAAAVGAVRASGRGAVVVVPDYRDLEQLEVALAKVLPAGDVARLTADDGQTPRYRSFLRILSGEARVAIGTRSAAYAPVRELGLVVCWDDGDDLHIDQRAPYAHTREVLLLRAEQENAACLMASHSRSTELQRLVEMQWAVPIEAPRTVIRSTVPRVLNTADSFEQERDPLARIARLPGAAWRAAKEGLEHGPVLVQVARAGYAPSLACETCRELARCNNCQGPLAISSSSALPLCRWCSTPAPQWRCNHCNGTRLRRVAAGAVRTAEELGRAFPGQTVITSSGENIKATVPDAPALVIATVGAEPVAPQGYAAALLLDGNSLLRRENLRAGEDTVRRWFNAASLVKPSKQGGLVVITADDTSATGALLRWDAPGYASRELALRKELQLPPAVRVASVTGPRADVGRFSDTFEASVKLKSATKLRSAGPAPLQLFSSGAQGAGSEAEADVRTLYFIPYADAADATRAMRAVKAANAAKRTAGPVQLRLDGVDVL
ncbi:primosomal protein N' [Arthrobacter sp. NtRootA1]|uniref:primosomal protein N' n=1 Tax=Arthrobacter sp. NtRootA1 TaxID=2830983 RepID=UPI001CC79C95|nr:primosomal protein N' [Arthrobacter sp. NtRootA1]BCW06604.1 putative primosomal protein N' [Arthrobacter sp. NtRootA1]